MERAINKRLHRSTLFTLCHAETITAPAAGWLGSNVLVCPQDIRLRLSLANFLNCHEACFQRLTISEHMDSHIPRIHRQHSRPYRLDLSSSGVL
ncbi:hypothetical protein Plim_0985 [Planctopirus limnophila DSM 3776]|uniref:Uncharacterized protein n=1 Tax=Planctopirus limnophila (strain ATCC 43296 / DSM 3776 / IFAM 1008 / Mu 290) TaxID=521674 RepID=D5ST61_PLAL2|nr:hypothetical protein Plim_0985 [Planctopirus limnophila DSM 3776]